MIRVMGKVDAARLSVSQGGLTGLINDLKLFQTSIAESLLKIEQFNRGIKYDTQKVISELKSA